MADFTKLNGYNVKDAIAREEIESIKKAESLQSTITPSYKGEIVHSGQASAVLKVNNTVYTFGANNWDGYGDVEVYNIDTNTRVNKLNLKVGHANSVCYNAKDNRIYISPNNSYNNGVKTPLKALYSYDLSLGDFREHPITYGDNQTNVYGVSFDHVQNKMIVMMKKQYDLYFYDFDMVDEIIATIDVRNFLGNTLLQDFAINNNIIYLITINREMIVYDIEKQEITNSYFINFNDNLNKYYLGETEGLEFSNNGELYLMNTVYFAYDNINNQTWRDLGYYRYSYGIITEIPLSNNVNNNLSKTNFQPFASMNLNEEFKTKFNLEPNAIKDFVALPFYQLKSDNINIRGEHDAVGVMVNNRNISLTLVENAKLNIGRIYAYGCILSIIENPNTTIDFTKFRTHWSTDVAPINARERTNYINLTFRGSTIGVDNLNLIDTGYGRTMVNVGELNGITDLKINNRIVSPLSLTISGSIVWTQGG